MLDYTRSFFYVRDDISTNRLFIEVDSRLTLTHPDEEYLLLAPHPRERTWQDDGDVYGPVLAAAQGASFITFMIDQSRNRSVILRHCDVPTVWPESTKLSVGASPYTGSLHNPPEEVEADELFSYEDIQAAADANRKMVATVEYTLHGRGINIEFPVRVLNMNPDPFAPVGRQWQVASPQVPVFIESSMPEQRIRPGYIAFGRLGSDVQTSFNYIGNTAIPRQTFDYSYALTQVATTRMFALRAAVVNDGQADILRELQTLSARLSALGV